MTMTRYGKANDSEAWRVRTPWPGVDGSRGYVVARGLRVRCVERLQEMVQRHERAHSVMVSSSGGDADALDAADDRMDGELVNPEAAGGGGAGASAVIFVSCVALAAVGASWLRMLGDQCRGDFESTSEDVWGGQGLAEVNMESTGAWAQPPSL